MATSQEIAPQARRIFEGLISSQRDVNPNNLSPFRFEEGIRRAIRWKEFETGFDLGEEVIIPPITIAKILSEEIFKSSSNHDPIYQREDVTDFAEAQIWLHRFLCVMEHLTDAEEFDLNQPRTFYVRGPMDSLQIGFPEDPYFANAAFPGVDLENGEFCYVKPVPDNLVALQFRILDPKERLIRKYAYDGSIPERFSIYTYREEEHRQFDLFNKHLLSKEERDTQQQGLARLRDICSYLLNLFNQDIPDKIPRKKASKARPKKFKIAGPARRIKLELADGKAVGFYHLHLEPEKVYGVEIGLKTVPGTETKTMAVKFIETGRNKPSSIHYFNPGKKGFLQIFQRKMDRQRVTVPPNFVPRIWDDENDPGIIL